MLKRKKHGLQLSLDNERRASGQYKNYDSSKDERRASAKEKKHGVKRSLDKERRASGQHKQHDS